MPPAGLPNKGVRKKSRIWETKNLSIDAGGGAKQVGKEGWPIRGLELVMWSEDQW